MVTHVSVLDGQKHVFKPVENCPSRCSLYTPVMIFKCLFAQLFVVVVQSLNCVQLFVTPSTAACQASLSFTTFWSLLKLMSIESVMPSNHLILCHPHLLLPSIFPSIRVFSNELALRIRWPKYWSFSISPSNEYSEFNSFRTDWFTLLASKGLLRVFLKASISSEQL